MMVYAIKKEKAKEAFLNEILKHIHIFKETYFFLKKKIIVQKREKVFGLLFVSETEDTLGFSIFFCHIT